MKEKFFMLIVLLTLPLCAQAKLSSGAERDLCFKEQKQIANAYNCLSAKAKKSEKELDKVIQETSKRILANYDYFTENKQDGGETVGAIYNKHFLDAQTVWKNYRETQCLGVASSIGERAYDYQSYKDQCVINLNKRHIEEIHLLDLPPVG